jgi:hypothetical protein
MASKIALTTETQSHREEAQALKELQIKEGLQNQEQSLNKNSLCASVSLW